MIGISRRMSAPHVGARRLTCRDLPPYGWSTRNVGRTGLDFQCSVAAINRLLSPSACAGNGPNRLESYCPVAIRVLEQKGNNVKSVGTTPYWDVDNWLMARAAA